MDYEEYLASLSGEEDTSSIEDAIAQINKSVDDIDNPPAEEDTDTNPETDPEGEPEGETETDPEGEPEGEPEDKPEGEEKPKQSAEENAKFAEARRQKAIDDRVQAELKRLQEESPEFKMAKTLSEMYNQPVEVIYQQLEEARIAKQAEQMKVPVEYLKQLETEKQERLKLAEQLNQLQFEAWTNRMAQEETQLKTEYPMLTDDDMIEAKTFLLQRIGRDAPLDQAVNALFGKKIIQSLKQSTKNETLAELSGRKKGALPPQGGKAAQSFDLSADELYIAKQMKMTPEEYHKYKTM
jgi:hypothetical protein